MITTLLCNATDFLSLLQHLSIRKGKRETKKEREKCLMKILEEGVTDKDLRKGENVIFLCLKLL